MVRNRKSTNKAVIAAMTELERARLGQSWLTALASLDRIDTLPDAPGIIAYYVLVQACDG